MRSKFNPYDPSARTPYEVEDEPSYEGLHKGCGYDPTHFGAMPLRRITPYGCYFCSNGEIVLFNWNYQPLFVWDVADSTVYAVHGDWWVTGIEKQSYFFDASNPPWLDRGTRKLCFSVLDSWANGRAVTPEDVLRKPNTLFVGDTADEK